MSAIGGHLQNSKQLCQGSADMISNLPAELLEHILLCLPLRDAARTSVLSRKWRCKWVSLPRIILDKDFFMAFLNGRQQTPHILMDYMILMNDILFPHIGPIFKFFLYIPHQFQIDKAISQWIRFVCDKSVKAFSVYDDRGLKTSLPTRLFSCVGLTNLQLYYCKIPTLPPTFQGFPSIIRLKLLKCVPTDNNSNVLGTLISQCPLLRYLYISTYNFFKSDLTICAPKLQTLFLSAKLSNLRIHLEGNSTIETCMVFVLCDKWYHSGHLSDFFSSLANVETLGLGSSVWETMLRYKLIPAPKKFFIEFKRLKRLHLINVQLNFSTTRSFILSLLEACPCLDQLYLHLKAVDNEGNDVERQPQFDGCLQCLKSIEIFSGSYKSYELQCIELLLAYSPILEVMTVALSTTMGEAEGKFNLANELLHYVRASPKARIDLKTTASSIPRSLLSVTSRL